MRFQVTQVMDAIEQRLTTDITGAQAVVDIGSVVGHAEFDRGRPVNLVRIGMVVDALGRYLVDGGALLYGVAERSLLSEQAFTSKERMVLGRWADDGLIEITTRASERVLEIADLTGLPVITIGGRSVTGPYRWLTDGTGRVLRIGLRAGAATLAPVSIDSTGPGATGPGATDSGVSGPAIGRAPVKSPDRKVAAAEAPATPMPSPEATEAEAAPRADDLPVADEQPVAEEPVIEEPVIEESTEEQPAEQPAGEELLPPVEEPVEEPAPAKEEPAPKPVPPPVPVFGGAAATVARTRISWHRFTGVAPDPAHAKVLTRQWRCQSPDCAAFGEYREIGQPAPRLRSQVPVCPRHGEPMVDNGPRPPAYPVSIVVDDLPRRRVVVRSGRPVQVGRRDADPDLLSVAPWLHGAARAWISPVQLELSAGEDGLTVTDLSVNGTVLWQRKGPDDPGAARPLRGETILLGQWDSLELYTGIELLRGDRRIAGVLGRDELASVLRDAPTAAYHLVNRF